MRLAINYKQCPRCGSKNSIRIVYGLPSYDLFLEDEAGKVKLGGCCIEENSPEYFCKDCNNEWNKDQAIDKAFKQIKVIKASVGEFFGGYLFSCG
jgi:transposase-like protein